jgi:hypothetical protein
MLETWDGQTDLGPWISEWNEQMAWTAPTGTSLAIVITDNGQQPLHPIPCHNVAPPPKVVFIIIINTGTYG